MSSLNAVITVLVALIPLSFAYWRWWVDRNHKRKTVVKAILAEVRRLLDVIYMHAHWWRKCVDDGDTDHPLLPFSTEVYDEHVGDIGSLDEDAVEQVVRFYGYVRFINRFQDAEARYREKGRKAIFDKAYLELIEKTFEEFDRKFDTVFPRYKIEIHPERIDTAQPCDEPNELTTS